jgi:hypothetical protein
MNTNGWATPTIRAKELVIAETMRLVKELEDDFDLSVPSTSLQAKWDQKVIKQMKKLVNRMARDIGADDQYFDVV